MRVSLTTLGCKANQFDTAAMAELFRAAGHEVVPFGSPVEAVVVNSCSVTEEAVRKSRRLLRRARRINPEAVLVLTGCWAQTGGEETSALPEVDLVVGPQDRGRVVELVDEYRRLGQKRRIVRPPGAEQGFIDLPVSAFGLHTRAWLKIQDGCEQFCTYCSIPFARGPVRSLPPGRVLEEAGRLTSAGHRELVLTGIHLGAYGRDLPGHPGLADIIRTLGRLPSLARLRLGSLEPNDVTPELIEAMAGTRAFCPHLHLPLQSGDDAVLARMGRPYSTRDYALLLGTLREAISDLAVSTDLMVGFPGETGDEFVASLGFVEEMGLSRLHVFPYSPRPGTPAGMMPAQVRKKIREERSGVAAELGRRVALRFNRSLVGETISVLVEKCRQGKCLGLAGQYVQTSFPCGGDLRNHIVRVRVTGAGADGLTGVADVTHPG